VPFNPEPAWIIKRARGNRSESRPYFRGMGDRGAAKWTKLHLQPPAAFIGAMLALREPSLNDLHILFVKVGEDGEGATKPALAEPAMANHAYGGTPSHAIANGTACTTSFMHLSH
jgi:hypothetical protein